MKNFIAKAPFISAAVLATSVSGCAPRILPAPSSTFESVATPSSFGTFDQYQTTNEDPVPNPEPRSRGRQSRPAEEQFENRYGEIYSQPIETPETPPQCEDLDALARIACLDRPGLS